MIRSDKLQRIAEIVMVLGIVALCQPWNFFLHRYGLTIIIIGLVTFMFTNWFGSKVVPEDVEAFNAIQDEFVAKTTLQILHSTVCRVVNRQTGRTRDGVVVGRKVAAKIFGLNMKSIICWKVPK